MRMLDRILQQDIKLNPNGYEYFCYRWTNLNTGKWYFGYHKGEVYDGYWQSGTNYELKEDFSNNENTWRYEVVEWFATESEAKRYEGNHNRKNKVRSNSMSYNIHEGAKPVIDINKAPKMLQRILNDEFEIKTGEREELGKIDSYQVRYIDYPDHVQYITDMIDENGGSIEKTDPLVIATGAGTVIGSDQSRIGGKHTTDGILGSKHATQYKYMEIDLSGWHKMEITQLGLLLNPEEEVKKISNVSEDYEKHLLEMYKETGLDAFSYEASQMLASFGLNTRARQKIANKVQKQTEQLEYERTTGKTWKKWNASSSEANVLMTGYRLTPKDLVMMMSSAMFSMDRIVNSLYGGDYDKVTIVIHHPNDNQKKKWQKEIQPEKVAIMTEFIESAGYEWEFVEAPTHKSDTILN